MAQCVSAVTGTDGVQFLTVAPDNTSCTAVVLTPAEFQQFVSSTFNLTLDQSASIGWMSLAPIVAAFLVKSAIKALD